VINRWFARSDGKPFFFAGIWREWQGDVGTIKEPNVGTHRLFAFEYGGLTLGEPHWMWFPVNRLRGLQRNADRWCMALQRAGRSSA
jgi:hypothetical protein